MKFFKRYDFNIYVHTKSMYYRLNKLQIIVYKYSKYMKHSLYIHDFWAFVAEWLELLTQNHLPFTVMGSNPARELGFFHEMT